MKKLLQWLYSLLDPPQDCEFIVNLKEDPLLAAKREIAKEWVSNHPDWRPQ